MLDIGSFLNLHFGIDPAVRNPLAVVVGFLIGLTTLLAFRRKDYASIDRFLLPITGLYILIFSYLSESPTSVLATAGIFLIALEALTDRQRSRFYWTLWAIALMLVPISYSDLVPDVMEQWARAFHLKTVGYIFVAAVLGLILGSRYRGRGQASSPLADLSESESYQVP
jgi:hypothetical protein